MRLNFPLWREALSRFETELKHHKRDRRRPRAPGEKFDSSALLLCKAEVTRLYCLRRFVKGRLHATGQLYGSVAPTAERPA